MLAVNISAIFFQTKFVYIIIHLKKTMHLQNPYYLIKRKGLNNFCGHLGMIFWYICIANIME